MIKELKKDQVIKCSSNSDRCCFAMYKVLIDFNIYEEALSFSDNPFKLDLIALMNYLESKKLVAELNYKEVLTTESTSLDVLELKKVN